MEKKYFNKKSAISDNVKKEEVDLDVPIENIDNEPFFMGSYESTKKELLDILITDDVKNVESLFTELFGRDHQHEIRTSDYEIIDPVRTFQKKAAEEVFRKEGIVIKEEVDRDFSDIKLVAERDILVIANGIEYKRKLTGLIQSDHNGKYKIIPWFDGIKADNYEIIFPPIKEITV